MSGDIMDNVFGVDPVKPPKPIAPPGAPPTLDEAAEQQVGTDRLKFRKGRASTRFGSNALGPAKTAGYKLLGASS